MGLYVVAGVLLGISLVLFIIGFVQSNDDFQMLYLNFAVLFLAVGGFVFVINGAKEATLLGGEFASGAVSVLTGEDAEFLSVEDGEYYLVKTETGVYRVLVVEDGDMKGIEVIYHGDRVVYGEEKESGVNED